MDRYRAAADFLLLGGLVCALLAAVDRLLAQIGGTQPKFGMPLLAGFIAFNIARMAAKSLQKKNCQPEHRIDDE